MDGVYSLLVVSFIFLIIIKADFLKDNKCIEKINCTVNKNSIVQVCIFLGIIILTIDKLEDSKLIFVIATIVSTVVTVRFLIKIAKMIEFESNLDLFYGTFSVLISILIIEIIINSNYITRNFFQYKTESKVIQIFIFHMIVLILLFVLLMTAIMAIIMAGVLLIISFKFIISKDVVILTQKIISDIGKIKPKFNLEIRSFFNRYFNPIYKIESKPLYKNLKLIRIIILISYIITGVIIIYYWNDLKLIMGNLEAFDFFSGIMNSIDVDTKDFENYRLIFIIPFIGVLTSKLTKK